MLVKTGQIQLNDPKRFHLQVSIPIHYGKLGHLKIVYKTILLHCEIVIATRNFKLIDEASLSENDFENDHAVQNTFYTQFHEYSLQPFYYPCLE